MPIIIPDKVANKLLRAIDDAIWRLSSCHDESARKVLVDLRNAKHIFEEQAKEQKEVK